MKIQWIIGALACVAAFSAQAQYKYIGPDGRVVYSDQPPPPTAKVLKKDAGGAQSSSAGGPEFPYALQQAVKSAPVTLYTAPSCGAPCNDGRALLTQRGIPFTEKTIATPEDAAEFTKTVNSQQIPVLMVGKNKVAPFAPDDWNGALTGAGYPASSLLPPGYKNPTPTNVAQSTTPAAPAAPGTPPAATPGAPQTSTAPPAAGGDKPTWFKGF
jgi:glutaredoxin